MSYCLYAFTNMHVTGIHAGIQAAHAVVDMHRKYESRCDNDPGALAKLLTYNDWADNHKTMRIFNGGTSANLNTIYRSLLQCAVELNLPVGKFHESGLEGALTAICIVVPMQVEEYQKTLGSPLAKLHTVLAQHTARYAS